MGVKPGIAFAFDSYSYQSEDFVLIRQVVKDIRNDHKALLYGLMYAQVRGVNRPRRLDCAACLPLVPLQLYHSALTAAALFNM